MNKIISTAARRIVIATVAAFALTSLPQAVFAANTETGLWRINPALSKSDSRSSKLVIERVNRAEGTAGALVVISRGNVYLATPAAGATPGLQPADDGAWKGMTLTQIGKGVRAINDCGVGCRFGEVSDRLTVTFRNTDAASEAMTSVLALKR